MPTKSVQTLAARDNVSITRAIWNDASSEFQQRIPSPDQGDIRKTFETLLNGDYTPQRNEFMNALVNRIGDVIFRSKSWTNPLAVFKRGMMEFGDTIEEIAGGILDAKRYDPNKCYTDVFACNPGEIYALYHQINRQDRYDLTINEAMLRRAVVNPNGLATLLDTQMAMPYNSDELDEFLIMKQLFVEMAKIDGFYKVNVPDLSTMTTQAQKKDAAFEVTEKVRAMAGKMRFMTGRYNSTGVPTFTPPTDLVLICTPDFEAVLDTQVLSNAFNIAYADLPYRIVLVDDLGIDGAQAILADESIFVCADTVLEFRSIENPAGLTWNYFLHHHGIYSLSRFVNCVLFTSESGTTVTVPSIAVTKVTVSIPPAKDGTVPTGAPKGGKLRLKADVTGTITPATEGYIVPQGVTWAITNTSGKPLNPLTYIDAEGVIHVGESEQNTAITVTATSTYLDPNTPISDQVSKSGSLDVNIVASSAAVDNVTLQTLSDEDSEAVEDEASDKE